MELQNRQALGHWQAVEVAGQAAEQKELAELAGRLSHTLNASLVIILGVLQTAVNIEFVALMHILLHHLGKLAVEHQIMPVCTVWHSGAILQHIAFLSGGETNSCHTTVGLKISYFRLCTNIAYEHYFIHNS